jgi:hypothetical protein
MTEETTPQVDATYYEQGIEILEAELAKIFHSPSDIAPNVIPLAFASA